jgi:hypothetical protein
VDRLVLKNQPKMKFGHFKLIFLTYEKPTYKKPTYETPTYETLTYETPTYETPTYENFSIFFGQFHSHMRLFRFFSDTPTYETFYLVMIFGHTNL